MVEKMTIAWFSRFLRFNKKAKSPAEWIVASAEVKLALLQNPIAEDMFWISFEIAPLTMPADPRLHEDDFWQYGSWVIIDARTNETVRNAMASSAGIDRQTGRISLRGLYQN